MARASCFVPPPVCATRRRIGAYSFASIRRKSPPCHGKTRRPEDRFMIALGMIGAGRWGSNWIKTLARLDGVELRWCCDVSPASLAKVKAQFPLVKTSTRLEDVLEDEALAGVVIA